MKSGILTFFLVALAAVAAGQTSAPDSDPVIQGSVTYSMPQSAIDAEIDGIVMVALRVDETGKPTKAAITTGPVWPCGSEPIGALEDLSSTIADTMMKVRFAPAMKDGKPIAKDLGLRVTLKNPRLAPRVEIDQKTGKPIPRQISGGVLNGKAKKLAKPTYPVAARANGDHGPVNIQILIDEEGNVVRAGAVSGARLLQSAARDAACRAEFAPTQLSGNPVRVSGVVTYNFVL